MKKITLLLLLLLPYNVYANNNFDVVQDKFRNFINNQDFKKAESLKDEYLKLANENLNNSSDDYTMVLHDIADLYKHLTEFNKALDLYLEILNIINN